MKIRFLLLIPAVIFTIKYGYTQQPAMMFGDTTRLGRPVAKDPHLILFDGRYLMYYSVPGYWKIVCL